MGGSDRWWTLVAHSKEGVEMEVAGCHQQYWMMSLTRDHESRHDYAPFRETENLCCSVSHFNIHTFKKYLRPEAI